MSVIPESMMERLRLATEQFRQARLRADDTSLMSMEEQRALAAALRAAEKNLEDVTRDIDAIVSSTTPPTSKPGPDAQSPGSRNSS